MGFLDKAKAAATDLASKADTALSSAGLGVPGASEADRYFKELGRLTYLEATGRPAAPGERDRLLTALHTLEAQGALAGGGPTAAPPAPGMAAHTPPPAPGYAAPSPAAPPAPGFAAPPPAPGPVPPAPASPPPPSWASGGQP